MIAAMNRYLITALLICLSWAGLAQSEFAVSLTSDKEVPNCKPPKNSEIFHDYINSEQKNLLKADGKTDNLFAPSDNEEVNFMVTRALINKVDELQCAIESDSTMGRQTKVKYLRGVENLLKFFNTNYRSKKVKGVFLSDVIAA